MRGSDPAGRYALTFRSQHHAIGHELCQHRLVDVLQLASAALGEMATWRIDVVGPTLDAAILGDAIAGHGTGHMLRVRRDAIAARGKANDLFAYTHRQVR